MKKSLILISSCIPFLLAGCSFTATPSDAVSNTGDIQSSGNLSEITGTVQTASSTSVPTLQLSAEPLIISNDEDGISKESYEKYSSQLSNCVAIDDSSWDYGSMTDYTCKEMRGYKHIYYSPELGFKISYQLRDLDPINLTEFFEKDPRLLTIKDNAIYDTKHQEAYIKFIEKDAAQSPEQIVKTLKYGSCEYKKSDNSEGDLIVYSTEECSVETNGLTVYSNLLFSKTKTSYFYQEMYMDGCAPGACTSFAGAKEYFLR